MTNDSLDLLRTFDPVAANDPAEQVTAETRAELMRDITATLVPLKSTRPVRRRLAPVLVAAAAVVAITVVAIRVPAGNDRPEALSFTAQGDVIKIRVLDPEADSKRFTKELEAQGLNIELKLLPASPSRVGQTAGRGFSGDANSARITTTTYPAGCAEHQVRPCVPEFTIARDFRGQAQLYIGRAAKPGERYSTVAELNAPGEALAGSKLLNQPVGTVATALEQRGFTVEYRVTLNSSSETRSEAPSGWFVHFGYAISDRHAVLEVGPAKQG
jgi:hypothetical protein